MSSYLLRGLFNSVMFGADKIPDSWFEKVPGGFYRSKENAENERQRQRRRRRHYSDKAQGYEDDGYGSDDYSDRRGRRGSDQGGNHDSEAEQNDQRGKRRGKSVGAAGGDLDGSRSEEPPPAGAYGQPRPYNPAEYAPIRTQDDPYNTRPHEGGNNGRYVAVSALP